MFKNLRVLYIEDVEEYKKKLKEKEQLIAGKEFVESRCDETLIAQPIDVEIDLDETLLNSEPKCDKILIDSSIGDAVINDEKEEIESSIENKEKQIEELFNEIVEITKLIF